MESNPYNINVKFIQSFKAEDFYEYQSVFKSYDINKDGYMDSSELKHALESIGFRSLSDEEIDIIMKQGDTKKDGKISFQEFLMMMKHFGKKEDSRINVKKNKVGKDIAYMNKDDMSIQSYSLEERAAFAKVINAELYDDEVCKKYLPIDPDTDELFTRLKNGILLCKLINKAIPGTIDERVINVKDNMNVYLQTENLKLALNAAKSIGCQLVGVYSDAFREENKVLVLGIMWQVVKQVIIADVNLKNYPQLIRLLNEGEQMSDLLKLKPEELLLRWFNFHLKEAGVDKKITNFNDDIKDSELYTLLLNKLNKEKCDKSALNESDLIKRAEIVLDNAKKIGAEAYITPQDVVNGNTKLNTLFVAGIFNACHGLDPLTEEEAYEAAKLLEDDIEGSREERAFRMWINSLGLDDVYINNLYEESKTGILLCRIIDKVKPGTVNWKNVDMKTKNPFKLGVNCGESINAAKKSKFSIVGIGGNDIREGNKKYILAIVWQVMRAHTLQVIGERSEEDLLNWGNSMVDDEYKVKSLKEKSLSNSMFFISIMNKIEPRAINWDIIVKDPKESADLESNAKYAISIARKLGACVFLVWEDITEVKPRLLLTFLASLYDLSKK